MNRSRCIGRDIQEVSGRGSVSASRTLSQPWERGNNWGLPLRLRQRKAPWVSAQLGMCFGSSAWHAVCSDFNVMRKGAVMAVASPRMVSRAVGHTVTGEDLGGWRVHADHTGFADAVADTDDHPDDSVDLNSLYKMGNQSLIAAAKALGVTGSTSMRKQELIFEIMKAQSEQSGLVFAEGAFHSGWGSTSVRRF